MPRHAFTIQSAGENSMAEMSEAERLWRAGVPMAEIAARVGATPGAIHQRASKGKWGKRKGGRPPRPVTPLVVLRCADCDWVAGADAGAVVACGRCGGATAPADGLRAIALTQGKFAVVDEADYDRIAARRWYYTPSGYAQRAQSNGAARKTRRLVTVLMHRELMGLQPIQDASVLVDHANRNGLDNRRLNVRRCTHLQNVANRARMKGKKSSRFKGVFRGSNCATWQARIYLDGQCVVLGRFKKEEDAAAAYAAAAQAIHGDFACADQ